MMDYPYLFLLPVYRPTLSAFTMILKNKYHVAPDTSYTDKLIFWSESDILKTLASFLTFTVV